MAVPTTKPRRDEKWIVLGPGRKPVPGKPPVMEGDGPGGTGDEPEASACAPATARRLPTVIAAIRTFI